MQVLAVLAVLARPAPVVPDAAVWPSQDRKRQKAEAETGMPPSAQNHTGTLLVVSHCCMMGCNWAITGTWSIAAVAVIVTLQCGRYHMLWTAQEAAVALPLKPTI